MNLIILNPLFIVISSIGLIFVYKWFNGSRYTTFKKLPPSPPRLPIIGNLYQLGSSIHRSLDNLSHTYGDIMLLFLGSTPTLVVSSGKLASEIMKTHDINFSNRPFSKKAYQLFSSGQDIAFSKYGEYWRQMKSLCVLQLLTNQRVRSFRSIRVEETLEMVEKIVTSPQLDVNLSEMLIRFTNDVICRAAFGKKYSGESRNNIMELMHEFMSLLGGFCLSDFIPWLGWIDKLSGLDEKIDKVAKQFDEFLERVVQEHTDGFLDVQGNSENDETKVKGFVDVLLEAQKDAVSGISLDRKGLKAIILDMFAAGTDTTYTAMEWAMSELLRHPKIMKKLQEEVRNVVKGKSVIDEGDLDEMNYLKAVIKETLRLHPPVPMLLFRESTQDVKINGYDIAKHTQVIVNAWTIQRDASVWEDPELFNPNRFLISTVDYRGHDFELIPFGAGRRGCPGITFAIANTELVLATLLYQFNWTLPGGAKSESLNMDETNGIVIHRRNPLLAVATPCCCN